MFKTSQLRRRKARPLVIFYYLYYFIKKKPSLTRNFSDFRPKKCKTIKYTVNCTSMYCCIRSSQDRLGFYAEIQISFGTVSAVSLLLFLGFLSFYSTSTTYIVFLKGQCHENFVLTETVGV